MNKKGCTRWVLWLGLPALVIFCIVATSLVYFQARARAFNSRPLVLIHSPINHEQVRVGDGILVHATGREDGGLRRIELWVDNVLVGARDALEGSFPTTLVFSDRWIASAVGEQELIVRAIAADGTEGQASVLVETFTQDEADSGTHIVEEGENLETIAEEPGTTPEEDEEPPTVGGGAQEGGGVPEGGGSEPPTPEVDAPGAPESAIELILLFPLELLDLGAGEPTSLRVEFLRLTTSTAYEQLHCYVGSGDVPPLWYPDEDDDQTTDESFMQEGADSSGAIMWSVESLSGVSAPIIFWPRNRDLPIDISCVGISGGGTEAFELGRWEGAIPPDQWTGIPLAEGVTGMDGSFQVEFRITRMGGGGSGVPIFLDRNMAPPTNAHIRHRLNDNRTSLRWDYEPPADEEPIDGFRIYLNDNLQWVEPADVRESNLPPEWYNPPCGTTYSFAVTAFRYGSPDGPESLPSVATLEQPLEDCSREVQITFLTLKTFNLGGDGDSGDRTGDVGPVYGDFYANEQSVTFDGGDLGGRGGRLDLPNGMSHYTTYNLGEMAAISDWRFSGPPSFIVDVPLGGTFEFGYSLSDEDSGRCRDSDDPGCDELLCQDWVTLYEENEYNSNYDNYNGELDRVHEGVLGTRVGTTGSCEVTYQLGPAFGSPMGSGVAGEEPLPWIEVEDIGIADEATGRVQIHVRNTGSATWPGRDLKVELQSRDGVSLGVYTWPEFALQPGQRTVLEQPNMSLAVPFDACVVIDPFDEVLEEFERSGALSHGPVCPGLPDLVITDVGYNPDSGQIEGTVINRGDKELVNRTLSFETYLPDGSPLNINGWVPNVSLGRWNGSNAFVFSLHGIDETVRQRMQSGYSVVVNPDETILENDTTNNTFDVPAPNQLKIRLMLLRVLYNYRRTTEFFFTAYVGSGTERRQVADFHFEDIDLTCEAWTIHRNNDARTCRAYLYNADYSTPWFPISGDETLEINVRTTHRRGFDRTYSYAWQLNDPHIDPWWGAMQECDQHSDYLVRAQFVEPIDSDQRGNLELSNMLTFQVCRESP